MNLGQAKTTALQLIREYSSDGILTGESENADYLISAYKFADTAQKELAKLKKIYAVMQVTQVASAVTDVQTLKKYDLPADYMELQKVYFNDGKTVKLFSDFQWLGKKTFAVSDAYDGVFDIHYYKYPTTIDETTHDDYEFELDVDAQEVIPFYIASKMVAIDNITLSVQLLNEYELKKSQLITKDTFGITRVENSLGW